MPTKFIKQYGLQRSGTNIAKALLEENYNVRVLNLILGSKHLDFDANTLRNWTTSTETMAELNVTNNELARIKGAARNGSLLCTLIIKNPHAWALSLNKFKNSKSKSIIPFDVDFLLTNVPFWISRNTHWLTALPAHFGDRFIVCSYDTLISDPDKFLRTHETQFDLSRNQSHLIRRFSAATSTATDGHHGVDILSSRPFDSNFYNSREYLNAYTESMNATMTSLLADISTLLLPFVTIPAPTDAHST
jgi:hypothetical protein